MYLAVLHRIEDGQKNESHSANEGKSDCRASYLPLAVTGIADKSPPVPSPELDDDGHIEKHDRESASGDEERFQRPRALFDGSASALIPVDILPHARSSSEMSVIEPGSCSKCCRAW